MNAVDLLRHQHESAHDILAAAMKACPPEALHWRAEGATVGTIAQICMHTLVCEDAVVRRMLQGRAPLCKTDEWAARAGPFPVPGDMGPHYDELGEIDVERLRPYATAVRAATDGFLAGLTDDDLDRTVDTGYDDDMTLGAAFSLFVVWHAAEHTGEIAALAGVQGHRGLPF